MRTSLHLPSLYSPQTHPYLRKLTHPLEWEREPKRKDRVFIRQVGDHVGISVAVCFALCSVESWASFWCISMFEYCVLVWSGGVCSSRWLSCVKLRCGIVRVPSPLLRNTRCLIFWLFVTNYRESFAYQLTSIEDVTLVPMLGKITNVFQMTRTCLHGLSDILSTRVTIGRDALQLNREGKSRRFLLHLDNPT